MFVFKDIPDDAAPELYQFELTGSTYEPIGETFMQGQKINAADYDAVKEITTICMMCNDSAIDFNEVSHVHIVLPKGGYDVLLKMSLYLQQGSVSKIPIHRTQ